MHASPFIFLEPFYFVGFIIGILIFLLPTMKILHKAGYSRASALTAFVPLLNFVMLWVFAFSRWPSENKGA